MILMKQKTPPGVQITFYHSSRTLKSYHRKKQQDNTRGRLNTWGKGKWRWTSLKLLVSTIWSHGPCTLFALRRRHSGVGGDEAELEAGFIDAQIIRGDDQDDRIGKERSGMTAKVESQGWSGPDMCWGEILRRGRFETEMPGGREETPETIYIWSKGEQKDWLVLQKRESVRWRQIMLLFYRGWTLQAVSEELVFLS